LKSGIGNRESGIGNMAIVPTVMWIMILIMIMITIGVHTG
jgi:hypothetical protein